MYYIYIVAFGPLIIQVVIYLTFITTTTSLSVETPARSTF
jgi:hypothetical protein